jgi:SAM-dependent methyltransferase
VLHHVFERADRVGAVAEVRRVLTEGGRALFSAWGAGAEVFEGARRLEGGGPRDFLVPFKEKLEAPAERFFHAYAEGELAAEAGEAGFAGAKEWTARDNRFCEVAR